MFKKTIALLGLFVLSVTANAAPVAISGEITGGTGALAGLAPPGTAFAGNLEWTVALDAGRVLLGGFCFTDDASGLPPASASCGALTAVPLLTTGQATYNGTPPPPGSTFEQAGTTFDGTSGVLVLTAFSPTFNVNIGINLVFDGVGGGTVLADAGALGTATGDFTVFGSAPPSGPSNAIPAMPLSGLILTGAALALVAHRRLRQLVGRN